MGHRGGRGVVDDLIVGGRVPGEQGYGGHPMKVAVYRRTSEQVTQWLHEAGFTIDMDLRLDPDDPRPGAVIFAR
jgi:hypothetical protein